jgi:hypothetical protein
LSPFELTGDQALANEVLKAVLSELHAAGIRDVTVSSGGNHQQVRFKVNGQERMFTVACTASDVRAVANARSDIRRLLRSLGLLIPEERSAPARQPSRIELLEQRLQRLEARIASLDTCSVG